MNHIHLSIDLVEPSNSAELSIPLQSLSALIEAVLKPAGVRVTRIAAYASEQTPVTQTFRVRQPKTK